MSFTPKYKQFIFEDYDFDAGNHTLSLHYGFDDVIHFTERFHFDFPFSDYDQIAFDRACQILFFMAGVSYYKAYLAPEIIIKKGELDEAMAQFFSKTYQRGLGEFFYVNQFDPKTPVTFPTNVSALPLVPVETDQGILVGLGGGKDSLVTADMLRSTNADVATWSLNHRPQLDPLAKQVGLPHYSVEREWDASLLKHNEEGALNGHVPISGIIAACGVVVTILSARRDVVVSNELSANEPTLYVDGIAINHQYSKSAEFETDFQTLLGHVFQHGPRYYSFLRPLSELYIAELFCKNDSLKRYQGVFSSCNRAFVHTSDHISWDGTCAKCAFFYLVTAPFAKREELDAIFGGKNLLHEPALEPIYRQLLGIAGDKPLDCVGEIKESRTAMRLAQEQDPSLRNKYSFDIPADYDYQAFGEHHMPPEVFRLFEAGLTQLLAERPE